MSNTADAGASSQSPDNTGRTEIHYALQSKSEINTNDISTNNNNNNNDDDESENPFIDYIKSIIYGGLDGIITTFAVVAGVQGADLSAEIILILGFANLVADSISMGAGDYLSEKAEMDYSKIKYNKLLNNFNKSNSSKQDEINKLINVYNEKKYDNLNKNDINNLVNILSKNNKLFVNYMMIEKYEMEPYDPDNTSNDNIDAMKSGLVTMTSFLIFGCVPLIAYVIFQLFGINDESNIEFIICIILTLITMATLGAVKGKITNGNIWMSALFVAGNGAIAASASYLISWFISVVTDVHG